MSDRVRRIVIVVAVGAVATAIWARRERADRPARWLINLPLPDDASTAIRPDGEHREP